MKIAFMFPGQGTQRKGMCKDIYDNFEEARQLYKKASDILDIDIAKLCFDSDEEELNKTSNTQIAILVSSLAICKVLEKYNIKPQVECGLSLGEYTALISSGALDFEQGLKLVRKRGQIMENAIFNPDKYCMAAVIGLDSKTIEEVCKTIEGFVVPSNYNYSMQTVISGYRESIEKASQILKEKGAKRIIELNTAGPFHTEKLNKASEDFELELKKCDFKVPKIDVLKNIDGTLYNAKDNFIQILKAQMTSPVRLDKIIRKLDDDQIDLYVEIGPGTTLSGFVKKENRASKVINIENVEGIKNLVDLVKEN